MFRGNYHVYIFTGEMIQKPTGFRRNCRLWKREQRSWTKSVPLLYPASATLMTAIVRKMWKALKKRLRYVKREVRLLMVF
jgi:hypothetical protein